MLTFSVFTHCIWTVLSGGWCSWTAAPGRAACRRTGCGGRTHGRTTCSNGTWNPSRHVSGGRSLGKQGLRAAPTTILPVPFHLSALTLAIKHGHTCPPPPTPHKAASKGGKGKSKTTIVPAGLKPYSFNHLLPFSRPLENAKRLPIYLFWLRPRNPSHLQVTQI